MPSGGAGGITGGGAPQPPPLSSDVFIRVALEQLLAAKETRRLPALRDSARSALAAVVESHAAGAANPHTTIAKLIEPLRLACQSRLPFLAIVAVDCLGKLFSCNFWGRHGLLAGTTDWDEGLLSTDLALESVAPPTSAGAGSSAVASFASSSSSPFSSSTNSLPSSGSASPVRVPLSLATRAPFDGPSPDRASISAFDADTSTSLFASATGAAPGGIIGEAIEAICATFSGGDTTDERLQLQIVKALTSAVSSVDPVATIHGAVLLRAVRTAYNIFLLSKSANAQTVSQASLTHMIQAVFGRIPKDLSLHSQQDVFDSTSSAEPSQPLSSPETSQGGIQ
ncbi:guanine nucleotide exchange protein for ADP-robosylation factor [Cladochytrium tenue]|nr:guanine nucleotide exchange protein for ADP-robosylation factor [Cladochytrium tenue]